VLEPSGVRTRRDIVHHSGSVVILAVEESNSEPLVLLEQQYRHAAQQTLWELPAGRSMRARKGLAAANRELLEETGYTASRWKCILRFYASPAFWPKQWICTLLAACDVAGAAGGGRGDPQPDGAAFRRRCHGHEGHHPGRLRRLPGCSGSTSHNMAESRTHGGFLLVSDA